MLGWFYELIYILLSERQFKNNNYVGTTLNHYSRFRDYVTTDYPFWIFSLNHDLVVELLACHYNINYKTGFYNNGLSFPLRDDTGRECGRIPFQEFDTNSFKKKPLDYFNNINDRGLNLFKLHGSLDTFLFDDRKKYLKVDYDDCSTYIEVVKRLEDVNTKLQFFPPMKVTNEISFADDNGEMQFLRKSILSGMHKFKNKVGQNTPEELLPAFKQHLNYVHELAVVGYGFGDVHINQTFREWLGSSSKRKLVIVNPGITTVPDEFKIYLNQTEVNSISFLSFLAQETKTPLTKGEQAFISLRKECRKVTGK